MFCSTESEGRQELNEKEKTKEKNYPSGGISVDCGCLGDLEDFTERDAPERIYLLKVRLRNTNNTETGIDLLSWKIQSNSVVQSLDFELYYELNQLDTYSVALRENSEKEFLLPYNLRKDFFYPSEWENLEDYEMWLTVTWYPTKKMLLLI